MELFLAELFGREHYRVDKDFVAASRQVDLFVMRGGLKVLVEAKWTKRPCGQDVIDSLRARLEDAPPGVVGLVVSALIPLAVWPLVRAFLRPPAEPPSQPGPVGPPPS